MSYDIYLCDHVTHKPLKADSAHFIAGGMRAMGGTKELWLNVTYNYGHFYYRPEVFGEGGIRSIYGKTGAESIPMLEKAISALGDDVERYILLDTLDEYIDSTVIKTIVCIAIDLVIFLIGYAVGSCYREV